MEILSETDFGILIQRLVSSNQTRNREHKLEHNNASN